MLCTYAELKCSDTRNGQISVENDAGGLSSQNDNNKIASGNIADNSNTHVYHGPSCKYFKSTESEHLVFFKFRKLPLNQLIAMHVA
jgi:hypothetical protein